MIVSPSPALTIYKRSQHLGGHLSLLFLCFEAQGQFYWSLKEISQGGQAVNLHSWQKEENPVVSQRHLQLHGRGGGGLQRSVGQPKASEKVHLGSGQHLKKGDNKKKKQKEKVRT